MSIPAPHFLLYAEVPQAFAQAGVSRPTAGAETSGSDLAGRWRFVLRRPGDQSSLEAADEETDASPQRLELLAVVRGLEALEQPSRVTLMSASRHLRRGLQFGLREWRENDWQWERYGRMVPVKDRDLWRRLDRLAEIHSVDCGPGRLEKASDLATPPIAACHTKSSSIKRGQRVLRIDAGHNAAKHQAPNTKSHTNSKSKGRNDLNVARSRHWNFRVSNLSGTAAKWWSAWKLVLGILKPKRVRRRNRAGRHIGCISTSKEL